jgi:hypothetical protein
MRAWLINHRMNTHNFGCFCVASMVSESQEELSWLVHRLTHERLVRTSYNDILPLLVCILRSTGGGEYMGRARCECIELIVQYVEVFGPPVKKLLQQLDILQLMIDSIAVETHTLDKPDDVDVKDDSLASTNLGIFYVLLTLLSEVLDEAADDGVSMHPWVEKLVNSAHGLKGLEGTSHQACVVDESDDG